MTRTDLIDATNEFFRRHWNLSDSPPRWSDELWTGTGAVPSYDLPGCYALLRENSIVYVGSAIGRGTARYKHFGLAFRLHSYIKRDFSTPRPRGKPVYTFRSDHYTGLYTIGFPPNMAYLAIALEQYLIARFAELANSKKVFYEAT